MYIIYRGRNSPYSAFTSYIEAVTAHIAPITAHIEAVTAHIETVTSHIEAATAHTSTVTAYTAPGTIKPPLEPTVTAPEKMANPFFGLRCIKTYVVADLQWSSNAIAYQL